MGLNYRISEFCAAVALAQFERVEEKVKLRRDIANLYNKLFSRYTQFKPQENPKGYVHSYFTYAVKSPFKNLKEWKNFYKYHTKKGGDDFYAMMSPVYSEDVMKSLGYNKWKKLCPITESIQPKSILFKTNYRSVKEAKKFIDKLEKSIKTYSSFEN